MRIAIVGAGVAGLSLGVMLKDHHDITIFEQSNEPGGLCKSTRRGAWTWDTGPHILGGIPEAVEWIKSSTGVEFVEGTTNSRTYLGGPGYRPHPMESTSDVEKYMTKMWKVEPSTLNFEGLNAQKGRKPGGVSKFLYPKRGGYQSITDAWVKQLEGHIELNTTATTDVANHFDKVIWTGPQYDQPYNTLITVTACCWGYPPFLTALYLPYNDTPFHRLSFPAALSAFNAPSEGFIVQGEITLNPNSQVEVEGLEDELKKLIERLPGMYISNPYERIETQVFPYAYPVPVGGNEVDVSPIHLHGRTGTHSYLNTDGVVAQSMKLAGSLGIEVLPTQSTSQE